jgi:hypothetical protein
MLACHFLELKKLSLSFQVEKETDSVRTLEQELAAQQATNSALEKRLEALEAK